MIAKYFTKKCKACSKAENDPDIVPTIRMKFTPKTHNVVNQKHLGKVKDWAKWSGGQVPAIQINGNERVERYVGVNGLKKLGEKVTEWFESRYHRKPSVGPISNNINLKKRKEVLKVA